MVRANNRMTAAALAFVPVCVAAWTAVGLAQNFQAISSATANMASHPSHGMPQTPALELPGAGRSKTASDAGNRMEILQGGRLVRQVVSLADGSGPTAPAQQNLPRTGEPDGNPVPSSRDNGGRNRQKVEYCELSPRGKAIPKDLTTSATPDSRILAERVAMVQERSEAGSEEWVDLAIPSDVFNAARPQSRSEQNGTIAPSQSAKPVHGATAPGLGEEHVQQQNILSGTPQDSVETEHLQLQPSVGSQIKPAVPNQASPEGPRDIGISKNDPSSSSGSSYSPDQAIPVWILKPADQEIEVRPRADASDNATAEVGSSEVISELPFPADPSPNHPPSAEYPSGQLSGGSDSQPGEERQSESTPKDGANHFPMFMLGEAHPGNFDAVAEKTAFFESDFSPPGGPSGSTFDPLAASLVYRGKFPVPVQRPLVELWRPLYTSGIYPPALTWFGVTNPMKPHFMVYGDMRTAFGANRNASGRSNLWGNVLNLDMDLQLTSTERLHAFVAPLNRGTQATGLSFDDEVDFVDATNFNFLTLFFEGDLGALAGGASGNFPPFDLPFSFGLIPLVYQNGIWANDAVLGAAVALPARHNRFLRWSNFDASLFWAADNVTSDAFPGQDSAADFFGTAWFIDAYEGYIEADYAFVNDNTNSGRSYHNIAMAFTRRYFARISNSIRFIVNTGQEELPKADRTADGHLLLIENSLISAYPNTVVPYLNLFYGQGRPQSLARVGQAGGILNNTGINFETDGITDYPTLDATGRNTFGLAAGINLLGSQFAHQLILETAMLKATGPATLRNAEGDQYAVGLRYQKPLRHNLIFRTDHMLGFREAASNLNGSRFEFRWKF